jgi:hypothetical protein
MQPLSSIRRRSAYNSLLAIALVWGITLVLVGILFLLSGYLGPWRDLGNVLVSYWWIWIGPLLLLAGAFSGLRDRNAKASIISIWAGCFSLTAMVLYQVVGLVKDTADPLITKPSLGLLAFHTVMLLLALYANVSAFRLSWTKR